MADRYYIRGAMRESGPFEIEIFTVQARDREFGNIVDAIKEGKKYYFLYAEGRGAILNLEQIDLLKEE